MIFSTRLRSNTRIGTNPAFVQEPELVREFRNIMNEWGSHVVYLRRHVHIKHQCWVTTKQQPEGLSVCPACYGTGRSISLERHLAKDWTEASPGRLVQSADHAEPGIIESPAQSLAVKPIVKPKVGDIIFRVEWNTNTLRPHNLIEAYEIARILDMREEQGILAFYKCFCNVAHINKEAVELLLRQEMRIHIVD